MCTVTSSDVYSSHACIVCSRVICKFLASSESLLPKSQAMSLASDSWVCGELFKFSHSHLAVSL